MKHKRISLQVVLIAAIILILLELLSGAAIPTMGVNPLLVIGFVRIIEIAFMAFILLRWAGGLASVGLTSDTLISGVRQGLVWSLVFGLCALMFLGILHFLGYGIQRLFQFPVQPSASGAALLLVVGCLISPFAEEMFFRGIIFGYLRKWGPVGAVLGSTGLFVLAHALASSLTLVQIIGGLVFAVAYEVEKNLMVPITIHVLGNTGIFTLSFMLAA